MLELKHIRKSYQTGEFVQHALKDVSLEFRRCEFVSILGPSGSGKTTLLNIIGGLDRYDDGDLIINQKSTKKFKDMEWDFYRNNCIGFIFQSYNLISHISVLDNVEMGMTLSGISQAKRRKKALEVLARVGLSEHVHKKPNQLSGGQMQRVAIARALANDPDIILADEPTGALDTETSVQIMELIKDIAKDKLVIMVTHNPKLAEEYASRIIEFQDGELKSDSNPIKEEEKNKELFSIRKTAMSFMTALKLSFHNIITKKGRTLLTAFASSIGIIGISLILSLSNGFDIQIDKFERDTLSSLPLVISEQAMEMDEEKMAELQNSMVNKEHAYTDKAVIYPKQPTVDVMIHKNDLTEEFIRYVEQIDPEYVSGISYMRATSLNMISKIGDAYKNVNSASLNMASIPRKLDEKSTAGVIEENYDLLKGHIAESKEDLMVIVGSDNSLSTGLLDLLGLDSSLDEISFDDLIGKELKLVFNDQFYRSLGEYFTLNTDFASLYQDANSMTLRICGIIRGKEGNMLASNGNGLIYTEDLMNYVIETNRTSSIVALQKEKDYNVLTGEKFDLTTEEGLETKENMIAYLGGDSVPMAVMIYPKDFKTKDSITSYLDQYNDGKGEEDAIVYNDYAKTISSLSSNIMDAITVVLIAFSAISLVVSSIMIGIITYISVLERTKEIGILRALGARKKDIRRVFNAETFLIGLCSGTLGILIARLLIFPANSIIESLTELPNVAKMNPLHALLLVVISIILTVIGGYIPARIASKKDPVTSLRTE